MGKPILSEWKKRIDWKTLQQPDMDNVGNVMRGDYKRLTREEARVFARTLRKANPYWKFNVVKVEDVEVKVGIDSGDDGVSIQS